MTRTAIPLSFLPVLILWAAVSIPFVMRTSHESYSHDFQDHVDYTMFIHQQKRLPVPGEGGGEGHQPPLYYLIASTMAVSTPSHVQMVRLFSVFLGALTLLILSSTARTLGMAAAPTSCALAFCATTPHFLFLFSSYNNDVLVIFWAILAWAVFLRYVQHPSMPKAWALGALTVAGFFSKFSFGAAWITLGAVAIYFVRRGKLTRASLKRLVIVQALALIPVLGWMYVHNVRTSGQWMALNEIHVPLQRLPHSALETILTPPGFTNWEWVTPYADAFLPIGKKNSLTAYLGVTSVFGEYSFPHVKDIWIWFILWVHMLWFVALLPQIRRSPWSAAMGLALAGGWISVAAYVWTRPVGTAMDFRHVAWLWLPLTILRIQTLENPPAWMGPLTRKLAAAGIVLGIVSQWALILLL